MLGFGLKVNRVNKSNEDNLYDCWYRKGEKINGEVSGSYRKEDNPVMEGKLTS